MSIHDTKNRDRAMPARSGRIAVHTASGSLYLVDLDQWRLTRIPRDTEPAADLESIDLRRDEQSIRILRIERLEIGQPAIFILEPLGGLECVSTTRYTTTIVRIAPWTVS